MTLRLSSLPSPRCLCVYMCARQCLCTVAMPSVTIVLSVSIFSIRCGPVKLHNNQAVACGWAHTHIGLLYIHTHTVIVVLGD